MIDTTSPMVWIIFNVFVIALILIDAFILSPAGKTVTFRRAIALTVFWMTLAALFNLGVYHYLGHTKALEFLTGYVIEQSLSIDNLFVFLLIFGYFKVPAIHQRQVLFWGIIGAQIMRAVFILAGVALLNKFHWLIYIFGGFLVFTGFKLFFEKDKEIDPEKNIVIKWFRKLVPVTKDYVDDKFLVRLNNVWHATPLLIVLIIIETTDLIFAVDSIPAVLAITKDPFIVYTSNIFAILGLRAMYFALAGLMNLFHHLHYGLGVILVFVGIKMLIEHYVHIPIVVALGFIALAISVSIMTSILYPVKKEHAS